MTTEYCGRHNWIIGSPRTVAARLEEVYREHGGFGGILLFCFDYAENPQAGAIRWELLAQEVMPKLKHLKPNAVQTAA